ncbi:MAG: Ldh family oxidoreductase [Devosia sp.]|uniref:Ldh family oxidoreductase n=1 Tax=Devosia sp. TaxID=1871048 RepID=UPI001ACA1FCA|nr:Ldh family oxidoreductase [Devosia sp.]MBN9310826.1 Ldh family oxidoreductase [Devosia sp.]MBN9314773.1 Ldh family oxidoreductase [Devosia sp.]
MIVRISYDELVRLLKAMFLKHACSEQVATLLAENMAGAERDGAHSHGIFRIKGNLASLETGWVDGKAVPVLEDVAPGMLRADGRNGFSLPVLEMARAPLMQKARANGIAILSVRKAHHFSAVWPDIEPFAREGFIALAMINSMASVVPYGGHRKVYGTNPFGFAAPRDGADPLVFDQASSAMANGDVQIARREGRQLPPGTGVDRDGNPTTDPDAVLEGGALLPFGGHKGSSLAMMMEIMGAALAGGDYSFEIDWSDYPGAATPHGGQTYIVIDPNRGAVNSFADRLEVLIGEIHDAGQSRLPGDRRYANRRESLARGIPVSEAALAELRHLAST